MIHLVEMCGKVGPWTRKASEHAKKIFLLGAVPPLATVQRNQTSNTSDVGCSDLIASTHISRDSASWHDAMKQISVIMVSYYSGMTRSQTIVDRSILG